MVGFEALMGVFSLNAVRRCPYTVEYISGPYSLRNPNLMSGHSIYCLPSSPRYRNAPSGLQLSAWYFTFRNILLLSRLPLT